jgi:hypothetical protein
MVNGCRCRALRDGRRSRNASQSRVFPNRAYMVRHSAPADHEGNLWDISIKQYTRVEKNYYQSVGTTTTTYTVVKQADGSFYYTITTEQPNGQITTTHDSFQWTAGSSQRVCKAYDGNLVVVSQEETTISTTFNLTNQITRAPQQPENVSPGPGEGLSVAIEWQGIRVMGGCGAAYGSELNTTTSNSYVKGGFSGAPLGVVQVSAPNLQWEIWGYATGKSW